MPRSQGPQRRSRPRQALPRRGREADQGPGLRLAQGGRGHGARHGRGHGQRRGEARFCAHQQLGRGRRPARNLRRRRPVRRELQEHTADDAHRGRDPDLRRRWSRADHTHDQSQRAHHRARGLPWLRCHHGVLQERPPARKCERGPQRGRGQAGSEPGHGEVQNLRRRYDGPARTSSQAVHGVDRHYT